MPAGGAARQSIGLNPDVPSHDIPPLSVCLLVLFVCHLVCTHMPLCLYVLSVSFCLIACFVCLLAVSASVLVCKISVPISVPCLVLLCLFTAISYIRLSAFALFMDEGKTCIVESILCSGNVCSIYHPPSYNKKYRVIAFRLTYWDLK